MYASYLSTFVLHVANDMYISLFFPYQEVEGIQLGKKAVKPETMKRRAMPPLDISNKMSGHSSCVCSDKSRYF